MAAEYIGAAFLLLKNYRILKMRYRNYGGEIDIIAVKGKVVVFIEVKARKNKVDALRSVTPVKQKILARAAEGFIAANPRYATYGVRFDVMVVTPKCAIFHLKAAWQDS